MAKLFVVIFFLACLAFALSGSPSKITKQLNARKQVRMPYDPQYSYALGFEFPPEEQVQAAQWTVPPKPVVPPEELYYAFAFGKGQTTAMHTGLLYEDNTWKVLCAIYWRGLGPNFEPLIIQSTKKPVNTGDKIQGVITTHLPEDDDIVTAQVFVNGVLGTSLTYNFSTVDWLLRKYMVLISYKPGSSGCAGLPRTNTFSYNISKPIIEYDIRPVAVYCGMTVAVNETIVRADWNSAYVFEGYNNANFDGANLLVVSQPSALACAQQCDENPSCLGWTYRRGGCSDPTSCYLKSSLGVPTSDTCAVSYPKLGETNKALSGGTVIAVYTGTTGAQYCSFKCEDNPSCRSWSFNGATAECTLVSDTPNVTAVTGVTSGTRALATGNKYYITNLRENKTLNNQYLLPTGSQVFDEIRRRIFVSAPPIGPDTNLQWTLVQVSPSYYLIKPVFDQTKCLDANWFVSQFGGINTPWITACNGKPSQQWKFVPQPNTDNRFVYMIVSTYGLCLNANPERLTAQYQYTLDYPSPYLWNCFNPDVRGAQWVVTLPHFGYTL